MRFYDRPLDAQSGKALHPIRGGSRIPSDTMNKIKKQQPQIPKIGIVYENTEIV